MLVNNPCVTDSRVIKMAEAVAKTGRRVTVVCRHDGALPMDEERKGVRYVRVEPIPLDWRRLSRRLLGSSFVGPKTKADQNRAVACGEVQDQFKRLSFTKWISNRARFIIRPIRLITRLIIRRILRTAYWLFETDEFGSAAEPHVRRLAPDVIHAHDLTTLPLGGRVATKLGARLLYDSHELEMHRNATYPRLVRWRRRQLESKYIRQADRVITVSESIADHLRDDYKIPRPTVIMNAPIFDETIVPDRDIRSDLKLDEAVPLAVYVGSVTVNRGIEHVVRALVHAPMVHFATVGPRRPATEKEVTLIAGELGVLDRLHFIDALRPEEVVGFIRTADVSVLPMQNACLSYYYCMPNKLLESVFAGVPVAVGNLLEMRRFVEAHGCGLVMDETNPKEIARAISVVAADREAYTLCREDREQLAASFGWPSQAARLTALYEGLGKH